MFVVVVAVIATGVWFFLSRRDSNDVTRAPVAASAAATPSRQPARQPAATGTPAAAAPAQPGLAPPPASRPRTEEATQSRATGLSAYDTPPLTPPEQPAPAEPVPQPAPAELVPQPAPRSPAFERAMPSNAPAGSATVLPIYDAASAGVSPPKLLTPLSHAPVRAVASYVPGPAVIEIMVNEDGLVQSVKTARPPATMGEALDLVNWLSITKAWRFAPAVRNGLPVKYRLIVPLKTLLTGRSMR